MKLNLKIVALSSLLSLSAHAAYQPIPNPLPVIGTVTTTPPANASTNVSQVNGTAPDTNSGAKSAGTLRVVVATDQPALTNALKVDGSAVTQPVSAASLPLPAGASTAAKQPALGTAGVASTDVLSVQGVAGGVAQPVSGTFWQATQPISGTVTANAGTGTMAVSAASLPLPSGASTAANQPTAATAGSTTAGSTGNLEVGAVTTAAPTYTTGQNNFLSLNLAGGLRVDGSGVTQPVSGTFWQTTQPVSFTQPALVAGTAYIGKVRPTDGTLDVSMLNSAPGSDTGQVSIPVRVISSLAAGGGGPADVGTSTAASETDANRQKVTASLRLLDTSQTAGSQLVAWKGDQTTGAWVNIKNASIPVTGTFWQATQPVSGTVTANAGTGTMAVSAASLPLPTGAAQDASVTGLQIAQGSTTSGQKGALDFGAVTTAAPTYTTAQSSPLSLTTAGALRVDASATTQPVSLASTTITGSVATNASQSGTWTVQPGNTANTTAWKVDGSAVTQPVSGTVTANVGTTAGLALDATLTGGSAKVQGNVASAAADSGNPLKVGGVFNTTQPTVTTGQRVDDQMTARGAQIVATGADAFAVNASQSGTWNIGTVSTLPALPANQSVNVSQINAVAPLMGNGVTGTGSQRVTIASDNTAFTVNAAESGTWTVQPGNTANTTPWLTTENKYPAAAAAADGVANPTVTQISEMRMQFNGTTWDRVRGNVDTTIAGDAGTKTATFNGATQTNYNARGAIVTIILGTVTGTSPTLTAQFQYSPDGGTTWFNMTGAPGNITATGNSLTLAIYPSGMGLNFSTTVSSSVNGILPRTWRLAYTIGGTSPSFAISSVNVNYIL